MGKAFDATGSYTTLLIALAASQFGAAMLMLLMPSYDRHALPHPAAAPSETLT
jgi:hypothetical protein